MAMNYNPNTITMAEYMARKAAFDQASNSESGGGASAANYDMLERMYMDAMRNVSKGIVDKDDLPKPTVPAKPTPKPDDKPTTPAKSAEELEAERVARVGKSRNWFEDQLRNNIVDAMKDYNVDPGDYGSYIDDAIAEAYGDITGAGKFEKTSQYKPFLNDDIGDTVLGSIRTDTQKDMSDALNNLYGSNFLTDTFADTMDDSILNSILNPQYDNAVAVINRAYNRGTLSKQGFDAAMADLEGQRTAGMSSLQSTGGGVLGGYRDDIGEMIESGLSSANKWDFGSNYKTDDTKNLVNSTITDLTGRLEGDIRNAVGGQQYFDWSDLIQRGGAEQGIYNPGTSTDGSGSTLFGAIKDRTKNENTQRGLGTQGAF